MPRSEVEVERSAAGHVTEVRLIEVVFPRELHFSEACRSL